MMKVWTRTGIAMLLVMVSAMAIQGWAQDTSCVNKLIPCLNYLNGTRDPPDSCCNPLKSVIESNPDCLCNLISNNGSHRAEQAGININEAQQLPGRCGEHVNPLSCLTAAGSRDGVPSFAAVTMSFNLQVTVMAIMSATIFQFPWPSNTPLSF